MPQIERRGAIRRNKAQLKRFDRKGCDSARSGQGLRLSTMQTTDSHFAPHIGLEPPAFRSSLKQENHLH